MNKKMSNKKTIFWTCTFISSCVLGIVFAILALQVQLQSPFHIMYGVYATICFSLVGLAVISRLKIHKHSGV